MNDQDKIALVKLLTENLSENDKSILWRRIVSEKKLKEAYENYLITAEKIDLFYTYNSIKKTVNSIDFSIENKNNSTLINDKNSAIMGSKTSMFLFVVLMVIISFVTVWGFNYYLAWQSEKSAEKKQDLKLHVQLVKADSIAEANAIREEELRLKGIDFTGLAITKTGLFLAPYEWVQNGTILASSKNNTNKIPTAVLWDDADAGLAILKFVVKDKKILPNIPYSFSRENYFLGEEVLITGLVADKTTFNYGVVVEDDEAASTFLLKLQLKNVMLGAPIIDKKGNIIGLVRHINNNGFVVGQKATSIYTLIAEMNLDKGVERIYIPTRNNLLGLSNADRINKLKDYLVHFNIRKNQ